MNANNRTSPWMRNVLLAAGVYNILWGAIVVLFPHLLWAKLELPSPTYIELWQCIGMILGVFGVGYIIASFNPIRYWPMVLVGFLGKFFGPIGFALAYFKGTLPLEFGWTILINDIIWLLPFGAILYKLYFQFIYETRPLEEELMFEEEFNQIETNKGWKLKEMSERWPLVIVFLRHFGCTFCREALGDLAQLRYDMQKQGKVLVIVHMSPDDVAASVLAQYQLKDVHHISDMERKLYRYFGLRRGFLYQLFGPKVWFRGVHAGLIKGHGLGPLTGTDGFQMSGIFLFYKGKVKKKFIHRSAADVPNYHSFITTDLAS